MWNDKETDLDLLGHDKIAQTVIEIIGENHLRPLTIGVYGDWGVGKSSVISLLEAKVKKERGLGVSNSHCIIFNGWLFQGYEDAKTALMETVIKELSELQPTDEKIQQLARTLLKRVNWLKVAKLSAGAILTGITGLPVGGLVSNVLAKAKEFTSTDSSEKFFEDAGETVPGQIRAFRKEFKELINSSEIDHVIVLVDDLDRCLPKSVIEVLEAIRLFLFVEGTTFVISADERMIEYAVREHFPNLPPAYTDYTKNYLEKLIQIPIRIPTLNKLQTGNYIRLLLLQNDFKNDLTKLKDVYAVYETKKKKPYDPVELSYEIVIEAICHPSPELKETLFVAGQITPALTAGLKGNPRNIKRFLNTLFLRMKIARIYGLDKVVALNVLAKLMLLERFQPEKFEILVHEVTRSKEGRSDILTKIEEERLANNEDETPAPAEPAISTADEIFGDWAIIAPMLKNVDLRPYVFVAKEKAVGFDMDGSLSEGLTSLLVQLNSNNALSLRMAENELTKLDGKEHLLLFEKLEAESRSTNDLKKMPASVNGLLQIIKVNPSLEERLIKLLDSFPTSELGAWAVSQFSGLANATAKRNFNTLLAKWSQQGENKMLKNLAAQTLKPKQK